MKLESFIAKRYLISKHKINFISIISFISIAGITIGVAALIVVLSVFNGFGSLVKSFLVSFDSHLRVEIISFDESKDYQKLEKIFNSIREIDNYTPFVTGKVLAYRKKETEVINLKGITETGGENVFGIRKNILFGEYSLSDESQIPEIILGLRLADKLETLSGDTLILISPVGIESVISQFSQPLTQKFIVKGIYSSNNNEYDSDFIFTSLEAGKKFLGYKNRVQGYDIRLTDIEKSFYVKEILEKRLNKNSYSISTWYDFHKDLYAVMQIERWAAYIILSLIIAVATFNILGSLSMSVIEKKRDIGILRSMGIEEKSVIKIFMFEGILIGIIGTFAGVILGYSVCLLQLIYNIYPLDPAQYKIDSLPLELRFSDFFFVSGASMLLTFLASLYPAKRAAKVNMLEAIKWE
jgi:lipoprotein-releasing system permease protein